MSNPSGNTLANPLIGILLVRERDHCIVDVNQAALQMVGRAYEAVVGFSIDQFFCPSAGKDLWPEQTPIFGDEPIEGYINPAQGSPIRILKSAKQICIDNNYYGIQTFIPLTEAFQESDYVVGQHALAEGLRDMAGLITQSLLLNEVLERILDVIGKVVPHDAANIMLLEGSEVRMTAWRGYDHLIKTVDLASQVRSIEDIPNMRRMAETGQPMVVPDTHSSSEWMDLNESHWIQSYVSAPVRWHGKTIGFLNLNSSVKGFYSSVHADRLIAFANQIAAAIENARLYEGMQHELAEREKAEATLQQAMIELEQRVEQRTAELRGSNIQLNMELARRLQAEQTLQEERALLALRVEERTAELSLANAELAKAAQLKDTFLASMSHELRTPLSAILNIAETLREQTYGSLSTEQNKALQTIEESGEHLLQLINDILDLSKIGADKLDLVMDEVEVEVVCRASLQYIQEAAAKKRLVVSSTIDPQVRTLRADARRLKQILLNLLNNAVKFTPYGGIIGLAVIGDREKNQVHFIVRDSGIGIPAEKIGQLFQPFIQLDNSLARHYEGTGLGLALVYKLVELHGGGIFLETEVGQGSSFTVTLRWEGNLNLVPSGITNSPSDAPSLASFGSAITDPIYVARRICNELGIETDGCWFELEALEKIISTRYDLFILDIRLLAKDREILIKIKNNPLTMNTPLILISQSRRMIDRPTLPFGINLLECPFTAEDMRKILRNVSPLGTASLIRRALIFIERNEIDPLLHPMILLAENNPTSKRILSDFLSSIGYRLSFSSNGIETIERAREVNPDLILINIHMPELDGTAVIYRIRHDVQIRKIPIIAITTLSTTGDRERCLDAGADEYFTKPLNIKDLSESIAIQIRNTVKKPDASHNHKKG